MKRELPISVAEIPTSVTDVHARIDDRLLDLDEVPDVPVAMATVTLLLWTTLYRGWLPMPGMDGSAPMSDPGVPEAMGTHNGVAGVAAYLLMWGVMMSAMMYPAMIPFVRRYVRSMTGPRVDAARAAVAFLGTYSLVWTATGVVPLAVDAVVDISAVADRFGAVLVGAAAVAAGLYQLTTAKRDSIATCCSTVSKREPSVRDAAERGVEHALSCVRCTWALFALMVVVGSMNLFWMLLLTAVVTLERFAPRREAVAATVGVVAVLGGAMLAVVGALGA